LEFDKLYGFLTPKPLNSGSGVEIILSFEDLINEDLQKLKVKADKIDLEVVNETHINLDIQNNNKVAVSVRDIVNKFNSLFADE
jgi:hypothetical protein